MTLGIFVKEKWSREGLGLMIVEQQRYCGRENLGWQLLHDNCAAIIPSLAHYSPA